MTSARSIAENVTATFKEIFSKRKVNTSAQRNGFAKRIAKKIDGYNFLVALTVGRFKKS